ncbi:hypothetical protein QVD17_04146 [Tagetes erecta]|uniref:BZIP domain-containing protein n=1 Tax=Tagetes erecta TaxID=13708 RepID=A0AAD8LEZ6_TARER|nr:hypothetical protein QVD17_04146 [Tagetes erecta]
MGSKEMDESDKEAKEPKKEIAASEEPPSSNAVGMIPPNWPGFQGYSPMPSHGYLAPFPQPPPYMWGVQHFIPPYGTTPHPYVMYPHGGIYAHPPMPPGPYPFNLYAMLYPNGVAEDSDNTPCSLEVNSMSSEGQEKLSIKGSKGSLGSLNTITGKNIESRKADVSANGSYPKSGESASEGSSEGSDVSSENVGIQNSQMNSRSTQDSMKGEASQNGNPMVNGHQNGGLVNKPMMILRRSETAAGPVTNLNRSGADSSNIPALHGKVTFAPVVGGTVAPIGSREKIQPQLRQQDERELKRQLKRQRRKQANKESACRFWPQDEKELKRQRRKQANREAACRSRFRQQGIWDELAQRAETLKEENVSLKLELSRIRSHYEQLLAENAALGKRQNTILGRLREAPGQEEIKQELG